MDNKPIIGSIDETATNGTGRAIGDVIAMQMAAIAYCSETNNVKSTLKNYLPHWDLVWETDVAIDGNYAFIAFDGVQYVIAIRGTVIDFSIGSFDNIFREDLNILFQTNWNYPSNADNPMISQGAADGLNALTSIQDKKGQTILEFLQETAFKNGNFLCVTGHSLGGNLATVFALWLKYQMVESSVPIPAIFSVLTFAAPNSWNQAFADLYEKAFTNSWRYYNVNDIIPFSADNFSGMKQLFPNSTVKTSIWIDGVLDTLEGEVYISQKFYHSVYVNVNQNRGSIALNTPNSIIYPVPPTDETKAWLGQASAQHDHNHYLNFMGSGAITCQ